MKIVYLAAGAGDMYCGSCLHGNTLAAALAGGGPRLRAWRRCTRRSAPTSRASASIAWRSAGSTSICSSIRPFSATRPGSSIACWTGPACCVWRPAAVRAVRPEQLGALSVSMLEGEHGRQRKEVEKLVQWLERDVRPDVVHLNNALLIGVAREIASGWAFRWCAACPAKTVFWRGYRSRIAAGRGTCCGSARPKSRRWWR